MFSFSPEFLLIALAALAAVTIVLIAWVAVLHAKISRLLRGKKAHSLEDTIVSLGEEIDSLRAFTEKMEEYLAGVEKRLQTSARGVATVRFNPFKGTGAGGNQSFATAFVNERGDGVVVSSLYARERIGIYAKPLSRFRSEYELTKEEKEAIARAKKRLSL